MFLGQTQHFLDEKLLGRNTFAPSFGRKPTLAEILWTVTIFDEKLFGQNTTESNFAAFAI